MKMNNKKELISAVDKLRQSLISNCIIEGSINFKEPTEDELTNSLSTLFNYFGSLPDNFEGVKEVKLSEILNRLNDYPSAVNYYYRNPYFLFKINSEERVAFTLTENFVIDTIWLPFNEMFQWIYVLAINNTPIIDDLKGNK